MKAARCWSDVWRAQVTARISDLPSPIPTRFQGLAQTLEHFRVAAGCLETPGVIVVLFGHSVPRMPQNERSIPNVLRVVDSNRSCGGVAKHVRGDPSTKGRLGVVGDSPCQRSFLQRGSDFRDPDRINVRPDVA